MDPNWLDVTANFGPSEVRHMAWDAYIPGNILMILGNALATVNLATNTTSIIAGNPSVSGFSGDQRTGMARFDTPYSFHQVNSTYVILIDTLNHCLVLISRETNTTTIFTGNPTVSGHKNKALPSSNYNTPLKIVALSNVTLAVTDGFNKCIRKLDLKNSRTSDLACLGMHDSVFIIVGIAIRPETTEIYFSCMGGIGMANSNKNTLDVVILTTENIGRNGLVDGTISNAVFDQLPETILFLDGNTMLITGRTTMTIRVVSLITERVSSICAVQQENATRSSPGNIETCYIHAPRALLSDLNRNRVLIGSQSRIGYIMVHSIPTTSTSSSTSTSTSAPVKSTLSNIQLTPSESL